MRRVLAAAALVAFMPTANAQDKGKSDFTHSGEFRVRDTFEMNESGDSKTKPTHENTIDQRFKLGLGFRVNEKLSFNGTLLQGSAWGQGNTSTVGNFGSNEAADGQEENFMSVNEAYATWMISDDFNAKFGRMNYGFGNGSVMSVNDWEAQPNSYEGVLLGYEAEFGKFQFFGFKYKDINSTDDRIAANTSDPQHDAYGLVFDLKTMPEWLKMVNVFVIQDVADGTYDVAASGTDPAITGTDSLNNLRMGASLGFAFSMIDLSATYVSVTGKSTDMDTAVKTDDQQSMMQAEVGANLPDIMGLRVFLGYHQDSGTKTGSTKDKTYDAYHYEMHENAGQMDILGWGNLTDMWLGATMKPMDSTSVGLAYHMFQKTEKTGTIRYGVYGDALSDGGATADKAKLGDEIDLWAEHKYGNGLTMVARVGQFMPGAAFKDATTKRDDSITQFMLEAKMNF